MTKIRSCKHKSGCSYAALPRRQNCIWHWLAKQSSDVQAEASRARLSARALVGTLPRPRVPERDWPEGERWCAGCQSFVPLFYCTGSRCKACNSIAAHGARLEKVYGIDAAEYDRLFKLQGGRCAICRNQSRTIRFATDHDHKTGEVRGLLCKRCNHELLGAGHDDVAILWRAITYLLFPPATATRPDGPPPPWEVVNALRAHLDERAAEARTKRPEPQAPPF